MACYNICTQPTGECGCSWLRQGVLYDDEYIKATSRSEKRIYTGCVYRHIPRACGTYTVGMDPDFTFRSDLDRNPEIVRIRSFGFDWLRIFDPEVALGKLLELRLRMYFMLN